MCVVNLRKIAQILKDQLAQEQVANRALRLADEIDTAIRTYGIVRVSFPTQQDIYAYEVDGYNSFITMDDANVPSLLSLPYLGYTSKTDPIYLATRKWLLSTYNPYYFEGSQFYGIGSPHTGWDNVWPMSIIMQALTSTSDQEILDCLRMLRDSSTNDFVHESFNKNNPAQYSRSWFAWANSLFGELILTLAREKPHLIF